MLLLLVVLLSAVLVVPLELFPVVLLVQEQLGIVDVVTLVDVSDIIMKCTTKANLPFKSICKVAKQRKNVTWLRNKCDVNMAVLTVHTHATATVRHFIMTSQQII